MWFRFDNGETVQETGTDFVGVINSRTEYEDKSREYCVISKDTNDMILDIRYLLETDLQIVNVSSESGVG